MCDVEQRKDVFDSSVRLCLVDFQLRSEWRRPLSAITVRFGSGKRGENHQSPTSRSRAAAFDWSSWSSPSLPNHSGGNSEIESHVNAEVLVDDYMHSLSEGMRRDNYATEPCLALLHAYSHASKEL